MKTCEEHDNCVVVYDSPNCPVCELIYTHKQTINEKDNEIQSLENKLADSDYSDGIG